MMTWYQSPSAKSEREIAEDIGTHLFESLESEIPLLIILLDDVENRRKEQLGVSNGNVSSSESRRTTNVFSASAELFDDLLECRTVRREIAGGSGATNISFGK